MDLYNGIRESIKWTIELVQYPDIEISKEPEHSYDYLAYDLPEIIKHTYELTGFNDVFEVDAWVLKNHPEAYIGHHIYNNIGDFSILSVPQAHAESIRDKSWATREGREAIVRKYAEQMHLEVGDFDYSEIDAYISEHYDEVAKKTEDKKLGITLKFDVPEAEKDDIVLDDDLER
jgi:hypothetical protein